MKLALTFVLILFTVPVFAYGQEGHEAICQIAYNELTDKARAEVDRLISLEPEADEQFFRVGCRWPDRYSEFPSDLNPRGSDHYINVPRGTQVLDGRCFNKNGDEVLHCLFNGIKHDISVLKDPYASDTDKLKALKFLGHWIGDIHQPLHVSYGDDKGGNDVLADATGCPDKLHSVWDTCIPRDLMMEGGFKLQDDRGPFGDQLSSEITDAERTLWNMGSPLLWASESYNIAQGEDVGYCIQVGDVCQYSSSLIEYDGGLERTVDTPDQYEDDFGPTVRTRLKQAGVRLGTLLNNLFD